MKKLILSFLAAAFCAAFPVFFSSDGAVFAESGVRGITLVTEAGNDSASAYSVGLSVDHENFIYTEDEYINAVVTAGDSGYLYLLYVDAEENSYLIFPNVSVPENKKLSKGEKVEIPGESKFRIKVSKPFGEESIIAVLSKTPIDFDLSELSPNGFTLLKPSQEKKLGIVVEKRICGTRGITREDVADDSSDAGSSDDSSSSSSTSSSADSSSADDSIAVDSIRLKTRAKGSSSSDSDSGSTKDPERFLCCVGVDVYKDSGIPNLKSCANDVKNIVSFFTDRCSVDAKNVFQLVNSEATLSNIKKMICDDISAKTKPGDIVFIYWSGHGTTFDGTALADSDEKDESCLLTYDTDATNLAATALIDNQFGHWIQNLKGRKLVIILDACYSGGNVEGVEANTKAITSSGKSDEWFFDFDPITQTKDIGVKGNAIISSCSANETSLVMDTGVSLMTHYLIEALKEHDKLTPAGIGSVISKPVADYAKSKKYEQHIRVDGDIKDTVIVNP